MSLRNLFKRWAKNEEGSFAVMTAVSALALLLMVGFATDTHYMTNQQQRLQSASDAIALRAFQSGERSQEALKNIAADHLSTLYTSAELDRVIIQDIRRVGDEVKIILAQNLDDDPAFFLPRNDVDVSAAASAGNAGDRINFALVLDTTGSMGQNGRIQSLMTASNRLIDRLEGVDNDQFRVSVVPFATYVNVGIANQNAPWLQLPNSGTWDGCVGSRNGVRSRQAEFAGSQFIGVIADETRNNRCGSELLPLTRDLGAVRTKVNSLTTQGSTYLPAGLMWGWRTLEPSQPFTEAQAVGGAPRKVMLFMTDGANTRAQNGNAHNAPRNNANVAAANLQTERVCDAAKAGDVEIYTIALQVNDNTTRNLLQDCATSLDHTFTADTEAELINAFDQIGRELGTLRLTN